MARSYTKVDKLRGEVRYELQQLERLAALATGLSNLPAGERQPWDAAAAAKFVADLYAGFENLCKRRLAYFGKTTPNGPDSHSQILEEFLATPELGVRLSPEMASRRKKYLRFRHRFIHSYGFEIPWEIVEEPLDMIPETVAEIKAIWEDWLSTLNCQDHAT